MNKIEVKILNPEVIAQSEKLMVTAARMTQKGHTIKNIEDFDTLYNKSYKESTLNKMYDLPHPTIQKFGVINIVVIGASRRFLAQITRHQNEVKFMSSSLQYSDYSIDADFVVPYELLGEDNKKLREEYLRSCKNSLDIYKDLIIKGVNNDDAGYVMPQSLRNVLLISATPYEIKHIISQRICKRNTKETRYVMLKIWEQLYLINNVMFSDIYTGPSCIKNCYCNEKEMSCGKPYKRNITPTEILMKEFPKTYFI